MSKYKKLFWFFALIILIVILVVFLSRKSNKFKDIDATVPFTFNEMSEPFFPDNTCKISDYGAVPGGTTLNTLAFQKAIADCSQKGGGKVYVPAGKWLTGAIHFESNINLNLDKNAEIVFSPEPKDYLPVVFTRIEGVELYNYSPFIYAHDAQNVAITGEGILNGQGEFWQSWKTGEKTALQKIYGMVKDNLSVEERILGTPNPGLRPSFVQFVNCKNVWLKDFSIINSPRWTIHPIYSENIAIRNLNINTSGFNSDGIVVDSSKNVLIENSVLRAGDDTISIKSGLDQDGWRVNKPSENIVIRNCDIEDGHSAIAIGSEMSGGVRNVFLFNLKLNGIDQGIRAKSLNGRGGIVENVWARNIAIGDAINDGIKLDLTYPAATLKSEEKKAPLFRNFYFDGVTIGKTTFAVEMEGIKNSLINNINFSDIKGSADKGIVIKRCENVKFIKTKISGVQKPPVFNVSKSKNIKY